jgi:uncharacterized membrane protein YfcA
MESEFFVFAAVGFLAQIVDGALGMAYGVVSTTVLLAFGVPPANASASVHVAELFTTGASGASHLAHKNVDRKLFWRLAPAGILGGILGAYILTSVDGALIRPFIVLYLSIMGAVIIYRAIIYPGTHGLRGRLTVPLGAAGGFVDAVGGGGWGPVVTSSLIGAGGEPRYIVGTVNTAEFLVTLAISASFAVALLTGHWSDAGDIQSNLAAIGGLIAGGLLAAPIAGYIIKIMPPRFLAGLVGVLVVSLAAYQASKLFGLL